MAHSSLNQALEIRLTLVICPLQIISKCAVCTIDVTCLGVSKAQQWLPDERTEW